MNLKKLRQHFLIALGLGFVARTVTAYFVYGAQSVDDYSHGVLPALEAMKGKEFEIPLWRSPLLDWVLSFVVRVSHVLGIHETFSTIRFLFFCLGTFSLLSLWAYQRYYVQPQVATLGNVSGAEERLQTRLLLFPLYFLSLHLILPFASTRAFGESIALTLVFIGLLMTSDAEDDAKKRNQFIIGASLLGLACLFRFQVGLLAVGYAVYLMITKQWRNFAWLAGVGLGTAAVEGAIDLAVGRWPLETLYDYFYVNKDGAVEHSIQPWYNTWFTVLPLWFIPLSLPLLVGLKKITRIEKVFLGLSAFFIFMHSLIPHKEERFLYPVAPLLLFVFARLWARAWGSPFEKFVFRPIACSILAFGLFVATTSNSQSGEYEPLLRAEKFPGAVMIWDQHSVLGESYFLHRLVDLMQPKVDYQAQERWPTASEIETLHNRFQGLMLTTSDEALLPSLQLFHEAPPTGLSCEHAHRIQSLADRAIYSMNPKYNTRRKPIWVSLCQWVEGAQTPSNASQSQAE